MIDLAALFREAGTDLGAPPVSGFPVSAGPDLESQASDENSVSGVSGVSGRQTPSALDPRTGSEPRWVHVRAGTRARPLQVDRPETPETPEKLNHSDGCSSGSPFQNPEMMRETGKVSALPSADGLALWWVALTQLCPDTPPCPGYRRGEWRRIHTRMLAFIDTFGAEAERLGWTGPRLFGVHPEIGTVRVDYCGALVLGLGGPVDAITPTEIHLGPLTHRVKPEQPVGIPIWGFGR